MPELSDHDKAVLNCIFNPSSPFEQTYDEQLDSEIQDVEDESEQVIDSKKIELIAVKKAEEGHLQNAFEILNALIEKTPRASLYNNRAQIFQLQGKPLDAFNDLTKAIQLAKESQKKTLCQALCQRGLIHRKSGRTGLARDDFQEAAKLGSQFAKNQLVELNPYAALCNQMLKQAFDDL